MKLIKTWLCGLLTLPGLIFADPKVEEKKDTGFAMTDDEVKLPGVTVNRKTHEIRLDAKVCLSNGLLEYVVCKPGTFEHEAIFTTTAKPEIIHAALLLSGLKAAPLPPNFPVLWWEDAMKKKDSRVKLEVEWKEEETTKRVNLTKMLRNRSDDSEDPEGKKEEKKVEDAWIFSGSFIHLNQETDTRTYAANFSGIIVGIWPDRSTVIQYGIENSNPYEGKHLGIEIDESQVPKVGTKVTLILSKSESSLKKVGD